jgi:hypothetical protein
MQPGYRNYIQEWLHHNCRWYSCCARRGNVDGWLEPRGPYCHNGIPFKADHRNCRWDSALSFSCQSISPLVGSLSRYCHGLSFTGCAAMLRVSIDAAKRWERGKPVANPKIRLLIETIWMNLNSNTLA